MPEGMEPGVFGRDTEFAQHRLEPDPHNVVTGTRPGTIARRKQNTARVWRPSADVAPKHLLQRGRHGKGSDRALGFGLTNFTRRVIDGFVHAYRLVLKVQVIER